MVIASALACIIFLTLPQDLFYPLNLDVIGLLSIIPLVSTIIAFLCRNSSLNKSVNRNVNALVLFMALVNIYIFVIL